MYQLSPPRVGRTALTFGAAVGIGAGIVQGIVIAYMWHATLIFSTFTVFIIHISLLIWIILFMLVGVLTARRTGKVSTGTLTGLWTGLIGGAITSATIFVEAFSSMRLPEKYWPR